MEAPVREHHLQKRIWLPVISLCATMLIASFLITLLGGRRPFFNIVVYATGESCAVLIAVLSFAFFRISQLARVKADHPLKIVAAELRPKIALLLVPLVVFPIFLGAYTSTKSSIPLVIGYRFDATLTSLDQAIFGTDPWRLTHRVFRERASHLIELIYGPGWTAAFALSIAFVPVFCQRKTVARFFTAIFLTWLLGGFLLAYAFASTGPIFAHLVDQNIGAHFAPLRADLRNLLPTSSVLVSGPAYLEQGFRRGANVVGGGISAMPSMHVATVTIYALLAKRSRFFWLAVAFAFVILIGSVHTGYHYFVDAPPAIALAWLSWELAGRGRSPDVRTNRTFEIRQANKTIKAPAKLPKAGAIPVGSSTIER